MSSTRKAKNGKPPVSEAPLITSLEEHHRPKMAVSTKREDELRARKLREIKAQIEEGTYRIDAADLAKSIVRREIVRLLSGKPPKPDKRSGS